MIHITYSPSWTFIPTHYCLNTCGYCVFVERTGARAELAPLTRAEAEIKRAASAGATELLIMSGEGIESAPRINRSLADEGFDDYISYLTTVARLALTQNILPHVNIGNVSANDICRLREVVPSMGMMLETVEDLSGTQAHRYAPDKRPARRIETLRAAGRARMPWTTGILVGIGETHSARHSSLETIARIHGEYGHIQEVIVQPFTPHAKTAMERWSAPTVAELRETVELARTVLPAEIVVQIPPNIAPDVLEFIAAGARDLGGISPDGDRINPQERWLAPERYRAMLDPHNYSLQPRLAVHERFISAEWLSADTLNAVESVRRRLVFSPGLSSSVTLPTQHRLYSPQRNTNAAFHL